VRLVFAGTPTAALPSLQALLQSGHEVVAVLTRPDAPSGRRRRVVASPVAEAAAREGIETLKPNSPRDPDFLARLREIGPDCCPVVAYGGLLPQQALDIPPHGWVNLHFSLLPAWRGAAPVHHALLVGDEITGATTFRIVRELDAGPVYAVMTERVRDDDTAGTLLDRLAVHGAALLVETLDGIASGRFEASPQDGAGVSFAPKVTVEDARIDWTSPALTIERKVRAFTPEPGAWTSFRGDRFKVGPVRPTDRTLPAGAIEAGKHEVLVGTGTQAVLLSDVRPQGKPVMVAEAWSRGVRVAPGERFDGVG
jgi:methionyl-tRNA formyltransferase